MTTITTKVACQATPGAASHTISLNHQCLARHIDCHLLRGSNKLRGHVTGSKTHCSWVGRLGFRRRSAARRIGGTRQVRVSRVKHQARGLGSV